MEAKLDMGKRLFGLVQFDCGDEGEGGVVDDRRSVVRNARGLEVLKSLIYFLKN